MKLTCFYAKSEIHIGIVLSDGGIIDATEAGVSGDLSTVIAGWEKYRPQLARLWRDETLPVLREGDLTFAPPAAGQSKVICIGLNYHSHVDETKKDFEQKAPPYPVVFSKFGDALAGHKQDIWLPMHIETSFDYEAELVVVIGRAGSDIPEEAALDHVFGYTCGNDLTIRDAQSRSGQWLIGKTYPGFAPVGPYLVTADALDGGNLDISCLRNGEVVQQSNTKHLIFSIPTIISYVSQYIPLRPGDLIFTGTPSGVILGKPEGERNWLKPGEELSVVIEGIGTLTNRLING